MDRIHARPIVRRRPLPLHETCVLLTMLVSTIAVLASGCGNEDPLNEAQRLIARGDHAQAISILREVLDERGDDAQVNYLYGRALTSSGQLASAEWSLRKAMKDPDWLGPAGTQLATNAIQSQNYLEAIELSSKVLESQPDNIDVLMLRARAYAASYMHPEETLADVERLLELDPGNTLAMEPKMLALLQLERYDEVRSGIEELGEMIEANPDSDEWIKGWHCATTAVFKADSGEIEDAEERFDECLELYPSHTNLVDNATKFFDDQQKYSRTREIYAAALEDDPSILEYRRRLALRTRDLGDREEAERILIEGTEVAEPLYKPAAYQVLAKHYQDLRDDEAAVATMKKAIEASSAIGDVPAQLLFEYADALVLKGDLDAAIAATDQMNVRAHQEMIRGRVAQERGEHEAALGHFEVAFELWPDNPWARYLAARSAESLGQFDQAVDLYRYAVRIDRDATDARSRIAAMLLAEGRPMEARSALLLVGQQVPPDVEGQVMAARIFGWSEENARVADALQRAAQMGPDVYGRALVATAEGNALRHGPEVAAAMLAKNGAGLVDHQDPARLDALLALVEYSAEAGKLDDAEKPVRTVVATHGELAASHAVLGRWLELKGAPRADVEASWQRALELDPDQPLALAGMARLQRSTDPGAAVRSLDRAAEVQPENPEYGLVAAEILIETGQREAAQERLRRVLAWHPYSSEAAAALASSQVAASTVTPETVMLAERAVRFGGGFEALELLVQVYREGSQPDRAAAIEARIKVLRDAQAARSRPAA